MAELKTKELQFSKNGAKRLVQMGIINPKNYNNLKWISDPNFIDPELCDYNSLVGYEETIKYNNWTRSLGGFINKCIYGPIFPLLENDYRECDHIHIYYPDENVSKNFIKFLRSRSDSFKNMKAKIYTDHDEFYNKFKTRHDYNFMTTIFNTSYLDKNGNVVKKTKDLYIYLKGFEACDFENRDLSIVNFTREYKLYADADGGNVCEF